MFTQKSNQLFGGRECYLSKPIPAKGKYMEQKNIFYNHIMGYETNISGKNVQESPTLFETKDKYETGKFEIKPFFS